MSLSKHFVLKGEILLSVFVRPPSYASSLAAHECLTLYFIEAPFSTFANRVDPDQAALVRAA